jgi:hypothetical protein
LKAIICTRTRLVSMLFLIKMETNIEQDLKQTEVKKLILKPTVI